MKNFTLILMLFFTSIIFSQEISLFEQYNGQYDYTAFGNTLNEAENNANQGFCQILDSSSANFTLAAGQTVVSAHLYWAGSGTGDFDVTLNGASVSASRMFSTVFDPGGQNLDFFAAYANVTDLVSFVGNGVYTFSDLTIPDNVLQNYCANRTNFAGWSIIVVYEDLSLTQNQVNFYDGLVGVNQVNTSLSITIDNIEVASDMLSKIGFLAWEGDLNAAQGESLVVEGTPISNPPLNPANNCFNSTNSFTGSTEMWNMDLDFYSLESIVMPGDTQIQIDLTSTQDLVLVNNIVTVVNSENPDATIVIDNVGVLCDNNDLEVSYTVFNVNSTDVLPVGTPIAFYLDGVLFGQTVTTTEIPIGGSETGVITFNFAPGSTPVVFTLEVVVDDDGLGNSTVNETNEDNNSFELEVDLSLQGPNLGPDIFPCVNDVVVIGDDFGPDFTYEWFFNGNPIFGETGPFITIYNSGAYQVEAFKGICFVEDEIVVTFRPLPVAAEPTPLRSCDEFPNDGFTIFDLTQKDIEITNGEADAVVSYFLSEQTAIDNLFPIANTTAYTNSDPNFQTVFARLQYTTTGCYDIVELDLIVDFAPEIIDPIPDYFLCDNDQDFVETFDLTSKDDEIENGLVNVTTTYYDTLADAEAGSNPILNPDAYTSENNEVFVVVENLRGCQTIGSFLLVNGLVPEYTVPLAFEQCDFESDGIEFFDLNEQNDQVVDGAIGLSVTYFGNMIDAENASNPLTLPYESMGGETVWVRIEDDITGCYGIEMMDLILVPLPTICEPEPLVYCDTDNDGIGEFILTERDDQVRCGDPSGNLVVSYHETQGEANANTNALVSPYLNIVPFNQIIFARISNLATGCYDTVELELIVGDSPDISQPEPLVLCDDDGDGIELFDLTSVQNEILAGLTGGPYVISYYEYQANADTGTNPIENDILPVYPNQPTLGNPQTIYIVVTDANGCFRQTTLELQVNLMPAITSPDPIILCETSTPPDGIESFDLTQSIAQITGGDTNILITFYASQFDLDTNNPIADPTAHENVDVAGAAINPQDIFIVAENLTTGCKEETVTLEIRVENAPSPVTPSPLVVCDDNNDGYGFFTLTDKDLEIIGGEPNVSVSYFETVIDAENDTNEIVALPYSNIIQFMQTVYARVEYLTSTQCFAIVSLDLIVIDSPEVPLTLEPLVACENDGDGFEIFDLTQQNTLIYGTQDEDDFTLTYHLLEADAIAGTPVISNPSMFTNTVNPQTIWYRLDTDDADNFCFSIGSFELQVVDGPVAMGPLEIEVCDTLGETNDGIFTFDLTLNNPTITGGVPGLNVQYFLTDADAQANTNAISPANEHMNVDDMGNAINPQTLFVRVTDSNTTCVDFTTIKLTVVSNPTPATDIVLELCDYDMPGDEVEVFDLTEAELLITGGANWTVQYYTTYQDAVDMTNGIPDPTNYSNAINPDVVYIRVDNLNNSSGCFEIVEVQLIVNPLPDDTAVLTSLVICEIPSDGIAEFDLTLIAEEALGPDQDPALFEVTYYLTDADAAAMINPIIPANAYPATIIEGTPFYIYTGITNLETGCYIGGLQFFELLTAEGATATTPAEPLTLCDAEGDNNGVTVFDLSVLDQEILGTQTNPPYSVTYHETLELAEEGLEPLPTSYTNIINPQEIYATVTNTDSGCSETVVVILNVVQLPFFDLPQTFRLCVDENGNPIDEDTGAESPPTFGIDLDENLFVFEWTLDGAVLEGEIGNTVTAVAGGVYEITATEIATGCSATAMTTVTLSAPPINYSARLVDGAFSGSNTVEILTEGIGTYEYSMDEGPFQESNIFTDVEAGSRMFTIRDVNGCGEVTFKFGVIDYDRFFTPNNDSYNDTWKIESIESFDLTANIYIFDRYGKLLKQLSPLSDGWNGTYNGADMPSSDYWFLIEYTEDDVRKEFRSHFTLKR